MFFIDVEDTLTKLQRYLAGGPTNDTNAARQILRNFAKDAADKAASQIANEAQKFLR